MRQHRILQTLLLAVLAFWLGSVAGSASDINSRAGTSAFPFLKINVSARAVAMGGAFAGLADDESALYYNPAGIVKFEEDRYILGYHNYFVDMQSGFAGYIHPLDTSKTIGVYASYLNYGNFVQTDEFGTTTGEFSGGDVLLAFSFALAKSRHLGFGATAKFIYQKIQDYSATGAAVDIGAKYTGDRERWGLGVVIQNLGAQFSALGDEKDNLPLSFRAGGSITPRGLPMTVSSDIIIPTDNKPVLALGGEYFALKPFYMRLGWNTFGSNFRAGDSDDKLAGFSVGAGFDIKRLQISYAFSPSADLGESHRVTLTGGF